MQNTAFYKKNGILSEVILINCSILYVWEPSDPGPIPRRGVSLGHTYATAQCLRTSSAMLIRLFYLHVWAFSCVIWGCFVRKMNLLCPFLCYLLLSLRYFFINLPGPEEEKLLGSILLPSYKISPCSTEDRVYRKFAFKAEHTNMRTYYFAADTRELMVQWMNALSLASILQEGSR